MAKVPDRPTDCQPFMVMGKTRSGQPEWGNKSVNELTWEETEEILDRLDLQLRTLHDLPKIDKIRPDEYMNETLWGLRRIYQDLHWRRIAIVSKK
jgi:hypothetical protein